MENFNYKNFTNLDFESTKDSLKQYLQQQDDLKDYNYEGSVINSLLNLLAYNTQYNGFYLNMHASERFLQTAQRRGNVVAAAGTIGYVPRSAKGAKALLNIKLNPVAGFAGTSITIPRFTTFSTRIENLTLTFQTESAVVVTQDGNGEFIANDVVVFEGKRLTYNYTFQQSDTGFVIPNVGVDTDRLTVTVKNAATDPTGIVYNISNYTDNPFPLLDSSSRVYFLEEALGQRFRIFFGDNVIGTRPVTGQVVAVDYFTTKGTLGNGASQFNLASVITDVDSIEILNTPSSFGGSDIESKESVRVNAPLLFNTQNRAVTARDYESIIKRVFPQAFSVSAWGGEETTPQQLGYVFASIIKAGFSELDILTNQEKEFIEQELRDKYTPVTILPAIVDPLYTYLRITSGVKFDSNIANPGSSQLVANVQAGIFQYGLDNFSKFRSTVRYSNLIRNIDDTDPSIVSNDTEIQVYGERQFKIDLVETGTLDIGAKIQRNTVVSSRFTYNGFESFFTDIGAAEGKLDMRRINNLGVEELAIANVADIDLNTGMVTFLPAINLNLVIYNEFIPLRIFADPFDRDISFVFNRIPILRSNDIIVTITDIATNNA